MIEFQLIFIIILYSIVQSFYGVGILLLGTPTLIYFEYSFIDTLNILIPPSITISIIQIFTTGINKNKNNLIIYKKNFLLLCLPSIFCGLFIVTKIYDDINFNYLIAITIIILLAFLKIKYLNNFISYFFNKYLKIFHILIGIIHGLTNMGGSFLSIYVSEITNQNTFDRRYLIAYSYFYMSLIQIITLYLTEKFFFNLTSLILILIAFTCYIVFYKLVKKINYIKYNNFFYYLLLFYALLLLI